MINYYFRTHIDTLIDVLEMTIQQARSNLSQLTERERVALSVLEDAHSELWGTRITLKEEEGFRHEQNC